MLGILEASLIRGWIQGIGVSVLGETYCYDAEPHEVRETLDRLRKTLAEKSQRLGRSDLKRLWIVRRNNTESWTTRALKGFEWLQSQPDPVPNRADSLDRWFRGRLSKPLMHAGIETVESVLSRMEKEGPDWWQSIRNFGKSAARYVQHWVIDHAADFSIDAVEIWFEPRQSPFAIEEALDTRVRKTAVVPLERFLVPSLLEGSQGFNRAPVKECTLAAVNDFEAIQAWLGRWDVQSATYRHYRKEIERFLLWAILERGCAVSSLATEDLQHYRRFLNDPQPCERWVGPMTRRQSSDWKPFQGPLSPRSRQQAETVLNSLFRWWVRQRYWLINPFEGLSKDGLSASRVQVNRTFTEPEWTQLLLYCRHRLEAEPATVQRYRRILWILQLAYGTGLRLQELATATVGDLEHRLRPRAPDQWWLKVTGKGGRIRHVPLVPSVVEGLNVNLVERGYAHNLSALDRALPLIGRLRKTVRETADGPMPVETPLSVIGFHQILRPFFKEAGEHFMPEHPEMAQRLCQASTHWLRHTHGSHAINRSVPPAVLRDNLGHSNLATTSMYLHTDDDQRYQAISEWVDSG